ncbi:putative glutathione-specific gamma-glutamylcyclotransferase 2 [Octopus vulgaris]|uniref:glutathione-specific gamma-glutamylcyclotransferase n=1 Tax=Octopus vulgaris TaxID=6645 RepID=A0AA36AY73_OCTVU|nr:putative glutathione-specific gamma-glutamylcyclotransferase 2 [Octopus vulgaris]
MIIEKTDSLWVFGYGSLTWKPNICYRKKLIGYIKGFKRTFWQGNMYQRGTKEKPGRVATLVESKNKQVWGVAFEVCGKENIQDALSHLETRETKLGGYRCIETQFHPRDTFDNQTINVICYTATSNNSQYLGPCDTDQMAEQIIWASGTCGTNSEYVLKLAQFIRDYIPEDEDEHLFDLEGKILEKQNKSWNRKSSVFSQTIFDERTLNSSIRSMKLIS